MPLTLGGESMASPRYNISIVLSPRCAAHIIIGLYWQYTIYGFVERLAYYATYT